MILTHLVFFEFYPGAGSAADVAVAPTYAPNWLAPSMRLGITLFFYLLWDKCLA